MAEVALVGVSKSYGAVEAVQLTEQLRHSRTAVATGNAASPTRAGMFTNLGQTLRQATRDLGVQL